MNLEPNIINAYARASPASDALHRNPDVMISEQGSARAFPVSDALQWRPIAVPSMQGFPCGVGRTRVKKLVHKSRIRIATWNIGSLTGKSIELVKLMRDRRVNIACLQETRWKGSKAKEIDGYKLWYVGNSNSKNGVGIVMDNNLKDSVVEVIRKGDRLLLVKLVLGDDILNIISAYAPQVGLEESVKMQFWEAIDGMVQSIPIGERIFIGGDLNGHVGKENIGYERIHGGFAFGNRNNMGESILDFAIAYDLAIANTYFKKRDEHLITYKSGTHKSQIDYFLVRKADRVLCKDCKVIPGESLAPQHRILVLDFYIHKHKRKTMSNTCPKIKWWNLKNKNLEPFKNHLAKENIWNLEGEVNEMWDKVAKCIKSVAKGLLGESKGKRDLGRETWWWNEEIQKVVKVKKECFKVWQNNKNNQTLEAYKIAKKDAKKIIGEAKSKAFEELYYKLGTREGEKDIFKLAKLRERKSRDLNHVKCIKDEDHRILVKDHEIKERWHSYFQNLLNESCTNDLPLGGTQELSKMNKYQYIRRIKTSEVGDALRKMKVGKALGPDGIPIEVWKGLGDISIKWLTKLFNKILKERRMPEDWRKSIVVPFFKNKGDVQSCNNYRGIKLMSHTMKLWERVIEKRLRCETVVSVNQFGFMPNRSTIEAIFLLRQLMEKYREMRKDLYVVFIDLEKAYDRVPRELIWKTLEKKGVSQGYIDLIMDMYKRVVTSVRTIAGETCEFPVTIGLHQGSALSPYLFTLVIDEVTRHLHDDIPWCMLFADDIVLIDESIDGLNAKLERWRDALESKGFKISRTKSEFMKCNFSNVTVRHEESVMIEGQSIPKSSSFRYLGSIIQENGEIYEDVVHRIKAGWLKWRSASGVLCDRRIPIKLKGKFYRTAVRPAMLYGTECWAVKKEHIHKMGVAEMRMLRWMSGKTKKDKIRNERIREDLGVAPIDGKMRENRLRWFGHVYRRPNSAPVKKCDQILVDTRRRARGRPKMRWGDVVRKDMGFLGVTANIALDRTNWRNKIHVADPK